MKRLTTTWAGTLLALAGSLCLAVPLASACPGSLSVHAVLLGWVIIGAYALLGQYCNVKACQGSMNQCMAWGLGGKFARTFGLAIVIVVMVWAQLPSYEQIIVSIGIGWLLCFGADIYSLYLYQTSPTTADYQNPTSLTTPTR